MPFRRGNAIRKCPHHPNPHSLRDPRHITKPFAKSFHRIILPPKACALMFSRCEAIALFMFRFACVIQLFERAIRLSRFHDRGLIPCASADSEPELTRTRAKYAPRSMPDRRSSSRSSIAPSRLLVSYWLPRLLRHDTQPPFQRREKGQGVSATIFFGAGRACSFSTPPEIASRVLAEEDRQLQTGEAEQPADNESGGAERGPLGGVKGPISFQAFRLCPPDRPASRSCPEPKVARP